MPNDREMRIKQTTFDGIDRSVSSNDKDDQSANILRDMIIDPDDRLKLRDEYAALYEDRPSQFQHTTNDDSDQRVVNEDLNNHEIYRSHGRSCTVVANDGTDEYEFVAYVDRRSSSFINTLYVQRAKRNGVDFDTFQATRVDVRSTPADNPNFANDWIEFSMRWDEFTNLEFMLIVHDDSAGTTEVESWTLDTIFAATFNDASTGLTQNNGAAAIESSTQITRDIDFDIQSGVIYAFWCRDVGVTTDIHYANDGDWSTIGTISLPSDIYGISAAKDPLVGTGGDVWLSFINDVGATNPVKLELFSAGVPSGSPITVASTSYQGAGSLSSYRTILAIDADGLKRVLYRTDQTTLKMSYQAASGGVFTGRVMTVTSDLAVDGIISQTCWDMVAKDGTLTVFYITATDPYAMYRKVAILDSTDENYIDQTTMYGAELVEDKVVTVDTWVYVNCYRQYEVNTNKRVSYIQGEAISTNLFVKYLHSDKGLFDDDFDGSVAEASSLDVQIESLKEPLVNDDGGTLSQILITQCDDDRLYKRGDYQWDLLEGSRLRDNSDWLWETVFENPAQIWAKNGTVRANAGTAATSQNAWYDYIDRYFFDNTADTVYDDHFSSLARLPAPDAAIITDSRTTVAAPDGYEPFSTANDTKVVNPYRPDDDTFGEVVEFFTAISFEYDGFQESQLRKIPVSAQSNHGFDLVGRISAGAFFPIQKITIDMNDWNPVTATQVASPTSIRLTAISIHWGIRLAEEDTADTVVYEKVKRVTVSGQKPVGDNVFTGIAAIDDQRGTKIWTDNVDGTYSIIVYPDYIDFANRTPASDYLGNPLVLFDSTAAGTEIYTKSTLIPEGYNQAIVVGDEVWFGGVRLAGVTRTNRLMRSARRLGSQVTPDQFSSDIGTVLDLNGEIKSLSKIGEDLLVVITSNGVEQFDVRNGFLTKVDELAEVGTNARLTPTPILEGGIGSLIRGVVYKDLQGRVRIFDGAGAPIIDAQVKDNHDSSNKGTSSFNTSRVQQGLDSTSAVFIYLPHHRKLILAYPSGSNAVLLVKDFESNGRWYDWRFLDQIDYATVGIDGEMFFTNGDEVFQWPKSGSDDVPDPSWRGKDRAVPNGFRGLIRKIWMDYLYTSDGTDILLPGCYKDRSGSRTNATNALADSSTQTRGRTGFTRVNSQFGREVAVEFHITDASKLTALEVDSIETLIQLEKKRTD